MEDDRRVVWSGGGGRPYERVAAENALRGYSKKAPLWLTTLILSEAWHVDPETVSNMKRGMWWAQRWSVYQEIKKRIEEKREPARVSSLVDDEPEWKTLERRMKGTADGSRH